MNEYTYKFKVGDKVKHIGNGEIGIIKKLTTYKDKENFDKDCYELWYVVKWNKFEGHEPEDFLIEV